MDQHTLLSPTTCFTVACVAFSLLAVSTVWRNQQTSTASKEPLKQAVTQKEDERETSHPTRPNNRRRIAVDSLYADDRTLRALDDRLAAEKQPEDVIEDLLDQCGRCSHKVRSTWPSGSNKVQRVALTGELSMLTAVLCQLQEATVDSNVATFPRESSRRAFDAVTASLIDVLAVGEEDLSTPTAIEMLTNQVSAQRGILASLVEGARATELPPTPPSEHAFTRSLKPEASGLLSPFEPSTGLTPSVDAKGWTEPPPEYSPPSDPSLAIAGDKSDGKSPPDGQSKTENEVFDTDALYNAVTSNEISLVSDLLEHGADPDEPLGELQRTALHQAAHTNCVACLTVLLRHNASMKIEDAKGDTALHLAAWAGNVEALSTLLRHGADIDWLSGRDGYSPLWCAISAYHIDAVRLLLRHGARVSLRSASGSGLMPLHQAAVTGQSAVCEVLLERGAQVDSLDDDNNTPLHYAAASGSVAAVRVLLRSGADVHAAQAQGLTPAHWAAHKGHTDVLDLLLSYGAPLGARATEGATPLHMAANRGHLPAVRLLLENGADPRLEADGWDGVDGSAANMAKAKGHVRCGKLIESWSN